MAGFLNLTYVTKIQSSAHTIFFHGWLRANIPALFLAEGREHDSHGFSTTIRFPGDDSPWLLYLPYILAIEPEFESGSRTSEVPMRPITPLDNKFLVGRRGIAPLLFR